MSRAKVFQHSKCIILMNQRPDPISHPVRKASPNRRVKLPLPVICTKPKSDIRHFAILDTNGKSPPPWPANNSFHLLLVYGTWEVPSPVEDALWWVISLFFFFPFWFYWRLSGSLSSPVICRLPPAAARSSKFWSSPIGRTGPVMNLGFQQHYRGWCALGSADW